jgi:hypothetical protein
MAQLELPDYEERLLVTGSNGSGKTVFLKVLLRAGWPRWVVVDLKGNFDVPEGEAQKHVIVHDPSDKRLVTADRVLYRPGPAFKNRYGLEAAFAALYRRAELAGRQGKPFIVVVDETLAISRMRATLWLGNLAVVGREWGCGLWVASQRLAWIPIEVKSEAWRWYVFFQGDEADELQVIRKAKGQLTLPELRQFTTPEPGQDGPPFVELRRGHATGGRVLVTAYPPVRMPAPRAVGR